MRIVSLLMVLFALVVSSASAQSDPPTVVTGYLSYTGCPGGAFKCFVPYGPSGGSGAGTTGTDFSANAATIPMAGFVLLATIPATPTRAAVEIQNQSAGTLQVVRDDGTGANQTTILLGPGSGAGTQGGGWANTTFKGRIRVYGASGAQVAADQE